jgi:hypothetical protein
MVLQDPVEGSVGQPAQLQHASLGSAVLLVQ